MKENKKENKITKSESQFDEYTRQLHDLFEKLATSEKRLKESQSLAKLGQWEVNHIEDVLYWSDEIYRIFEFDKNSLESSQLVWPNAEAFWNRVHPEDRNNVQQAFNQSIEEKSDYEIIHRLLFDDDRVKFVKEQCYHEYDNQGKVTLSVGTVQDITSFKEQEEKLRIANQELEERTLELETAREHAESSKKISEENAIKFQIILEQMPILVDAFDSKGKIAFWNSACEKVTGYSKEEMLGSSNAFELLYPDENYRAKLLQKYEETPNLEEYELSLTTKSGEEKIIAWSNVSNEIPVSGWSNWAVGVDVTPRKKAENSLRLLNEEAEKANQAKTSYLANMSHELRTPLNTIMGFSKMIEQAENNPSETLERVKIITESGEYLLGIINDILDLSKIEAGYVNFNPESMDIRKTIGDIINMFSFRAKEAGLDLTFDIDPHSKFFLISDAVKLRQIFTNLISNAIKFTKKGGVSIYVNTLPIKKNTSKYKLIVEVRDTGIGIQPDKLERIFQPFYQTKETQGIVKGTGLGLAITKRFIEVLNGSIKIESKVGIGSVFKVQIPVEIGQKLDSNLILKDLEVIGLKSGQEEQKVLIVEDNYPNRLLLSTVLKNVGFKVKEAVNGEEAVSIFKKWKPQFIWMDYRMPVMDGEKATKIIRKSDGGKDVTIVALTANIFTVKKKSLLKAGCNDVLHKPFTNHQVFETMKKYLGVHYDYNEKSNGNIELASDELDYSLYSKQIKSLSKEIQNDLTRASKALNVEETLTIIDQMEDIEPELAKLLRSKLDDLDFTTIQKITEL